jgi:hypothetical protein
MFEFSPRLQYDRKLNSRPGATNPPFFTRGKISVQIAVHCCSSPRVDLTPVEMSSVFHEMRSLCQLNLVAMR